MPNVFDRSSYCLDYDDYRTYDSYKDRRAHEDHIESYIQSRVRLALRIKH